jgi:hypothetical protein
MDSQGEDRPGGAPLQDCCTEWILKVRTVQVVHLFRTAAQNGFSRRGQTKWRTSSGLLHRTDSKGEDRPSGALFQDCYTLWSLLVGNSSFLGLNSWLIGIAHNILSSTCSDSLKQCCWIRIRIPITDPDPGLKLSSNFEKSMAKHHHK